MLGYPEGMQQREVTFWQRQTKLEFITVYIYIFSPISLA